MGDQTYPTSRSRTVSSSSYDNSPYGNMAPAVPTFPAVSNSPQPAAVSQFMQPAYNPPITTPPTSGKPSGGLSGQHGCLGGSMRELQLHCFMQDASTSLIHQYRVPSRMETKVTVQVRIFMAVRNLPLSLQVLLLWCIIPVQSWKDLQVRLITTIDNQV